jgi:riboflavin kinase/FMN adenylyltransferase
VVVGYDFRFGLNRKGTVDLLKKYIPTWFDQVTVIEQQSHQDLPISSTLIRDKVKQGDLATAHELLGRPYQLYGTVIQGQGRGRGIGFPTANLETSGQILPPNGVYGVQVREESLDAPPTLGVMNIGNVPTFNDQHNIHVEAHLLDYQNDLYGKRLIVDILKPIRGEQKFASPQELVQQIHQDIQVFRDWMKSTETR